MTLLLLELYESIGVLIIANPEPTEKLHFQYQIKRYFSKKYKVFILAGEAAATASWLPFSSCKTVLTLDSFILKWLQQTSIFGTYQAIQFFLVISCLFSVLWEHFQPQQWHFVWIPGVTQGLRYCSKHEEKYASPTRDRFLLQHAIYWSYQLLMQRKCVTQCFKWAQRDSNRRWLQNY